MSSTTTSSTSDSSSEEEQEDKKTVSDADVEMQAQDEAVITGPRKGHLLKRKRKDDDFFKDDKTEEDEATKEPKTKKRKLRKLEVPQLTGHVLHIMNIELDVIKGIKKELEDPLVTKLYPDVQSEIIDAQYLKRLPTEKQKQDWDAETKRLSREKRRLEGKTRKELTEEEKEQRRIKNKDPEHIRKKRLRQAIKKEVYDSNPINKAEYIKRCEAVLGKVVRKRTPRAKKVDPKKEEGKEMEVE